MKIGVIGAMGKQGRKHVNVLQSIGLTPLMCDVDGMPVEDFLHQELEAVIIASPTNTHFDIVKRCLRMGIPAMVEKPLCETVEQVKELCGYCHERCAVNFNQRFHDDIILLSKNPGDPPNLLATRNATRVGKGSLVMRMGIHDVDLVSWLWPKEFPGSWFQQVNVNSDNIREWKLKGHPDNEPWIDFYSDRFTLQKSVFAFLLQVATRQTNPILATFEQSLPVMEYLSAKYAVC